MLTQQVREPVRPSQERFIAELETLTDQGRRIGGTSASGPDQPVDRLKR